MHNPPLTQIISVVDDDQNDCFVHYYSGRWSRQTGTHLREVNSHLKNARDELTIGDRKRLAWTVL